MQSKHLVFTSFDRTMPSPNANAISSSGISNLFDSVPVMQRYNIQNMQSIKIRLPR